VTLGPPTLLTLGPPRHWGHPHFRLNPTLGRSLTHIASREFDGWLESRGHWDRVRPGLLSPGRETPRSFGPGCAPSGSSPEPCHTAPRETCHDPEPACGESQERNGGANAAWL
jgi:hypothetical protein